MRGKRQGRDKRIRYAVVGLGYIAQNAVLPAFAHARKNSELVALVSSDPVKLSKLGRKHRITRLCSYDEYEPLLRGGEVDAVFLTLPNHLHSDFTLRAARAGVHVLCEKPMAMSVEECRAMITSTRENEVKLMIAYRLHFERANLKAAEIARSGLLGDVRMFSSTFTMQVEEGNVRLDGRRGGGTLYDIGVYCINAARYLFRDEPTEAMALVASNGEKRFREVEEMTSAILRFPDDRLASFTCSFGSADTSSYRIIGTKGDLVVDPAYEYTSPLKHRLTIGGKTRTQTFPRRDQFAPEIIYFSDCVLRDKEPEPSGREGLIDVGVIQALYHSARIGQTVRFELPEKRQRPTMEQEIRRPPVGERELVNARPPRGH